MGLDWNPANKPLPGHEREFAALQEALLADPPVEAVEDAWNARAVIGAIVVAAVGWGLGWVEHPVRTGFSLCALLYLAGWPL